MQCPVDAQHASVGEVENEIGSYRLRSKVQFPGILRSQRDGEVGVQERERFLLVAFFEIDARVFRLDVGETRSTPGVALAGGSVWNVRRLHQNRSKVPASIAFPDQVQTG